VPRSDGVDPALPRRRSIRPLRRCLQEACSARDPPRGDRSGYRWCLLFLFAYAVSLDCARCASAWSSSRRAPRRRRCRHFRRTRYLDGIFARDRRESATRRLGPGGAVSGHPQMSNLAWPCAAASRSCRWSPTLATNPPICSNYTQGVGRPGRPARQRRAAPVVRSNRATGSMPNWRAARVGRLGSRSSCDHRTMQTALVARGTGTRHDGGVLSRRFGRGNPRRKPAALFGLGMLARSRRQRGPFRVRLPLRGSLVALSSVGGVHGARARQGLLSRRSLATSPGAQIALFSASARSCCRVSIRERREPAAIQASLVIPRASSSRR